METKPETPGQRYAKEIPQGQDFGRVVAAWGVTEGDDTTVGNSGHVQVSKDFCEACYKVVAEAAKRAPKVLPYLIVFAALIMLPACDQNANAREQQGKACAPAGPAQCADRAYNLDHYFSASCAPRAAGAITMRDNHTILLCTCPKTVAPIGSAP